MQLTNLSILNGRLPIPLEQLTVFSMHWQDRTATSGKTRGDGLCICQLQLHSTHRDGYKALPRPPFGKSDHNYILLIPANKLKLKEVPVTRSIRKWSDDADAKLKDCFAKTD